MSILEKLALPEIRELIHDKDLNTLTEALNRWLPADLADLLNDLGPYEDAVAFKCLKPELAARTFENLSHSAQEELIRTLPEPDLAKILNELAPDDRTAFLEGLPNDEVERLLTLLSPENQRVARGLLSYSAGTIGRLMTPEYIGVKDNWTVTQVLDHVRRVGRDSETLNAVYVTDDENHLIDDIRMREILLSPSERRVRDLMDHQFIALRVTDTEEAAVEQFRKYDRTVLPVIDRRGVMLGVVTVDDVLDVAQEAATEEIQRIGGTEALDAPYMDVSYVEMVKKRGVWLSVLFLGEMLTATAMGFFEDEIKKAVVLALFVPLIISSGGNSGSQAATLIVRSLALGEIKLSFWFQVLWRELRTSFTLGMWLGFIGFLRIVLWQQLHLVSYGDHYLLVGVIVWLSLIGVVTFGSITGSMLPFLLRRLGFDPATSSAPFVATLVDVTGLIIYFSVAMLVLRGTLL